MVRRLFLIELFDTEVGRFEYDCMGRTRTEYVDRTGEDSEAPSPGRGHRGACEGRGSKRLASFWPWLIRNAFATDHPKAVSGPSSHPT